MYLPHREMFTNARHNFEDFLDNPPWVRSLANILPLSALVDFVNVPAVLHTYQLTGAVPLWCWPVTPAGSRLLLAECGRTANSCCLDRYGSGSPVPICLDGRYGDMYPMVNAETLQRCVNASSRFTRIENTHRNMLRDDARVQRLELVHVFRQAQGTTYSACGSWSYWVFSAAGWLLIFGLIVLQCVLACWTSLAFYLVVLATGTLIKITFRGSLRRLSSFRGSAYNRLFVTALHVNETDWCVFYGESTIVNALLNRPLLGESNKASNRGSKSLRTLMIMCIFAQWALAVGAAATQDWNSFLVTAWIVMCVFAQSYLFTPARAALCWMQQSAKIKMEVYEVDLSTRRALLNTIMALNPDTFETSGQSLAGEKCNFRPESLSWMDPILNASKEREEWLEASRIVTCKARCIEDAVQCDDQRRIDLGKRYWFTFILEGTQVAQQLKTAARLSGEMVEDVHGVAQDVSGRRERP